MIKAGAIEKGMYLLMKGEPHLVAEREFVNPGKGAAFVRVKCKNLKTGLVLRETIKTSEQVEEADVYEKNAQYLYADDMGYHFMDTESFEQFIIPREGMEDKQYFIKEGETYSILWWDSTPLDINVPLKMVFEVAQAEEAVKGDTVTGATKTILTDTGLKVKVPIFIKQGEKILVNTDSIEYVERVNE